MASALERHRRANLPPSTATLEPLQVIDEEQCYKMQPRGPIEHAGTARALDLIQSLDAEAETREEKTAPKSHMDWDGRGTNIKVSQTRDCDVQRQWQRRVAFEKAANAHSGTSLHRPLVSSPSQQSIGSTTSTIQQRSLQPRQVTQTHWGQQGRGTSVLWDPTCSPRISPASNGQQHQRQPIHKQTFTDLKMKLKGAFGGSRLKLPLVASEGSPPRSDSMNNPLSPRNGASPLLNTPHKPAKPSPLRLATSPNVTTGRDSDPFVRKDRKSIDQSAAEPIESEAAVVPWEYQKPNGDFVTASGFLNGKTAMTTDEVEAFKARYDAPPIPASPTKVPNLRSRKSETSLKSTASTTTMAPPIPPPKSPRAQVIENPDSSPTLYVSRSAMARGMPQTPEDPRWDDCVARVKERVRREKEEEERKAAKGPEPNQAREAAKIRRQMRTAVQMIIQGGLQGLTPLKNIDEMDDQELQIFAATLDEALNGELSSKGIKKLFKAVDPEEAKKKIAHLGYLQYLKRATGLVAASRSAMKDKAEEQLTADATQKEAEKRYSKTLEMLEHGAELEDDAVEAAESLCDTILGSRNEALNLLEGDEPKLTPGARLPWLPDRNPDQDTEYGEPEEERKKAFEAICTPRSISSSQRSINEPVGLGIVDFDDEGIVARDFGATARLIMRKDLELAPSEAESRDRTEHGSVCSLDAEPYRSPVDEEPLQVAHRASILGHSCLVPRRNDSFMRKITEASEKRAVRLKASHPAMRGDHGAGGIPQVPKTAPILQHPAFNRESTFAEKMAVSIPGSAPLPCIEPDWASLLEDAEKGRQEFLAHVAKSKDAEVVSSRNKPPELFSPTARKPTAVKLLEDDYERGRGRAVTAPHLSTNFLADTHGGDHEEYDEAVDGEIEEIHRLTQPMINLDIDDVISQWQQSTPEKAKYENPMEAIEPRLLSKDENTMRVQVGLPPLRPQQEQTHPQHSYDVMTEKVMCYGVHTPFGITPPLPDMPQGLKVNMGTLAAKHFTPTHQPPPLKIKRCSSCGKFCCLYAEMLLASTITGRTEAAEQAQKDAKVMVDRLRYRFPNGNEVWDSFLACMDCSMLVCPACSVICEEELCRQVMCKGCGKRGRCAYHE